MRISELAKATDLSIDTIRFYEKQHLLDEVHFVRRTNRYRDYRDEAVQRLRLIRQAKAAGFTLTEIRGVIGAWEEEALDERIKREMLAGKIEEIKSRIVELQQVQAYLEHKLRGTV